MTTMAIERCEAESEDLKLELQQLLYALFDQILQPLDLGQPGFRGRFTARAHGHVVGMSWRNDVSDLPKWPRNARQLVPVRQITCHIGKQFAGMPITVFNGTAHSTYVNREGVFCFRGPEALKIFADTSDLRTSAW